MMGTKIRVFRGSPSDVEREFGSWLQEHTRQLEIDLFEWMGVHEYSIQLTPEGMPIMTMSVSTEMIENSPVMTVSVVAFVYMVHPDVLKSHGFPLYEGAHA